MPPHIHQHNSAERAIQTFINHFIAGLASTDPNFPLSNWCRLLPQAELTLNLLRPSRLNPKLSPYAQLEGAFDFNRTPPAPPGTPVIVHEKPTQPRMGPARFRWMVYSSCPGPLPMLPCMDPLYTCRTYSRHHPIFPTMLRTLTLSHCDATLQASLTPSKT